MPPSASPGQRVHDHRTLIASVVREEPWIVVSGRCGIVCNLGEEGYGVSKDTDVIQVAGKPIIKTTLRNRSWHPPLDERTHHVGANRGRPAAYIGTDIGGNGVRKGRNPDPRRIGSGLMVAVPDCRAVVLLGCRDILTLDHVQHDAITIVVVTDVFLVKPGQRRLLKGCTAIFAV